MNKMFNRKSIDALCLRKMTMRKRYIVAFTIVVTLALQFLASRTWLGRELLLSIIAPTPDPYANCLVLTDDVTIAYGSNTVGTLRAGQIIFQPCRHDALFSEPFDPRVWKIYVEFGKDNGRSPIAYRSDAKQIRELRNVVRLENSHEKEQKDEP